MPEKIQSQAHSQGPQHKADLYLWRSFCREILEKAQDNSYYDHHNL